MNPITQGRVNDQGKIARIQCIKNDPLTDLDIQDKCFLLLILYEGEAKFSLDGRQIEARAPSLLCFHEKMKPTLVAQKRLKCHAVYFHPGFFNINLTFDRVRSQDFSEAAMGHDLYLMRPFTDEYNIVFPMFDDGMTATKQLFESLAEELESQRDCYWSCRSRTYFIRLILMLERIYGLMGEDPAESTAAGIGNECLRAAVLFIEGHYSEDISRADIARAASTNHTTLNEWFKAELDMTAIDYLWHYRITIAKKQLRFTHLPVSEIAAQCGFKATSHFSRKFEAATGMTPRAFRDQSIQRRIEAFSGL